MRNAPVAVVEQAGGRRESARDAALRELVALSTSRAIAALSQPGGYLKNATARVPLPEELQAAATRLRNAGHGEVVDALEDDLNVSAEIAAGNLALLVTPAVARMTMRDTGVVLAGDAPAAVRAFREQSEATLLHGLAPRIEDSMRRTGLIDSYRRFAEQSMRLGAERPVTDIALHLRSKAVEGLFAEAGREEKAIRHDPARQGSTRIADAIAAARRALY